MRPVRSRSESGALLELQPDGSLHIATDWEDYARHIDEALAGSVHFDCAERRVHGGDEPLDRPRTKFESRGLRHGHRIWDWHFLLSAG